MASLAPAQLVDVSAPTVARAAGLRYVGEGSRWRGSSVPWRLPASSSGRGAWSNDWKSAGSPEPSRRSDRRDPGSPRRSAGRHRLRRAARLSDRDVEPARALRCAAALGAPQASRREHPPGAAAVPGGCRRGNLEPLARVRRSKPWSTGGAPPVHPRYGRHGPPPPRSRKLGRGTDVPLFNGYGSAPGLPDMWLDFPKTDPDMTCVTMCSTAGTMTCHTTLGCH